MILNVVLVVKLYIGCELIWSNCIKWCWYQQQRALNCSLGDAVRTCSVTILLIANYYHWWELTCIISVAINVFSRQRVCHNKTCLLLQQNYACCDKTFVRTYFCCDKYLSQHNFVTTSLLLSSQTCDKTGLLSWQKYTCRNKTFVTTMNKHNFQVLWEKTCFVATHMVVLSWQHFCCGKNDTCGNSG